MARFTRKARAASQAAAVGVTAKQADAKGFAMVVQELWELTVAYAKQEIRDPLAGLAAYLAWGIATMLLLATGTILLVLGALRALQTETGSALTGNWSWAPYAVVFVGSVLVLGLVGWLVTRSADPPRPTKSGERGSDDR